MLHKRLELSSVIDEIRFCIPDSIENDCLELFLKNLGYSFTRGSEDDLITRYQAATYDLSKDDLIVRVTSDCPLVDPCWINHAVKTIIDNNADYCSNYTPAESSRFCNGSDIEVFPKEFSGTFGSFSDPKDREHVTSPYGMGDTRVSKKMPNDGQDILMFVLLTTLKT